MQSHPVWVRGLKRKTFAAASLAVASHPVWVRGLKLTIYLQVSSISSRTLYGCVD